MYELELFAGAGGGLLAQRLLGHHPVGAIEIDPYCRAVLLQRQRDLCLPVFPVWDDVTTFRKDNPQCADYIGWLRTIAGELCISGGFPCQDISSGGKGRGITGPKSGLWFEMARIIDEIRPRFTFLENSPMLATRGFEMVLASLAGSVEPVGAVGNGQVPAVAAIAWRLLSGSLIPAAENNVIVNDFNAAEAA